MNFDQHVREIERMAAQVLVLEILSAIIGLAIIYAILYWAIRNGIRDGMRDATRTDRKVTVARESDRISGPELTID